MSSITIDDRVLALRLGVGDLVAAERGCWGYGACCNCEDCVKRDVLLEETGSSVEQCDPPRQPWEAA